MLLLMALSSVLKAGCLSSAFCVAVKSVECEVCDSVVLNATEDSGWQVLEGSRGSIWRHSVALQLSFAAERRCSLQV